MEHMYAFKARGHPKILAGHATTLMVTKEEHLTERGDCVVAVCAEASLAGLLDELKAAARSREAMISLTLEVCGESFTVTGRGTPALTYTSELDMVTRRSRYVCGRTLMVEADSAAVDLPRSIVRLLGNPDAEVNVTLRIQG